MTVATRGMRLVLTLAVLALLLAACAAEGDGEDDTAAEDPDDPAEDAEDTDEPILIGVNVEESGGASVQGEAYTRALELLAEQINDGGGVLGRELELQILDNRTEPSEAVTVTQRLVNEGAVAMVGPGTSPTTMAAMDVILDAGIPTISMGSADAISDPADERPNVFKTPQRGSLMASDMAAHMAEEGIERVGLLAVNNPYGDSGVSAWQQLEEEGNIDLVGIERFEDADTDMGPQLRNLIGNDAEAIVTWAIPPGAPTVRRNAVDNVGVDLPMYFDAGAGAELFVELAGSAADGAYIVHPRTLIWDQVDEGHPQHDALQEFGEAYTGQYGEMSGFAGYAWDALAMFAEAIDAAGSTEPEAIIDGLEGLDEYVGVTGTYELGPDDHQGMGEGDLVILTIEDGEWREAD
jgi:branched-chain amino acid transport system substrate-binding protein